MSWILPAVGYLVLLGSLGITSKLAQRSISWEELLIWTWVAYSAIAAILALLGRAHLSGGVGGAMGAVSGILASTALVLFYVALERGQASRVVPLTAAYPVVTLLLAFLVLSEQATVAKLAGTALVVMGVVLLTR